MTDAASRERVLALVNIGGEYAALIRAGLEGITDEVYEVRCDRYSDLICAMMNAAEAITDDDLAWLARVKVRPLTNHDILVQMAKANGGVVRVSEAKTALLASGRITGKPQNAYGHLRHLLDDSEDFEQIAPGTFRLLARVGEGR